MKKQIKKCLIPVICFMTILLSSYHFFFNAGWGDSSGNIQAKLIADKKICHSDDVVKLYVKFRNTGSTTKTLKNKAFYTTLNFPNADAIGSYPEGSEFITIKPGQRTGKYLIGHFTPRGERAGIHLIKGGLNYMIDKPSEAFGLDLEPIRIIVIK